MTGHELDDVGRTLSWGALDSFLDHLGEDSALLKEMNPEMAKWSSRTKTNTILADIYDQLAMINANLVAIGSRKAARKPKPYPRPGNKPQEDTRHFGSGALPKDELRKWIEGKQHAGSSTGHNNGHPGT